MQRENLSMTYQRKGTTKVVLFPFPGMLFFIHYTSFQTFYLLYRRYQQKRYFHCTKKERNKYALLSYRHLDVIIFGEGMWESNPPRTLLTPNTSFEDQGAHQLPNYPHLHFISLINISQLYSFFNIFFIFFCIFPIFPLIF